MAYPTPNTDAALAKVPEAVQADIELAFKKALEEGRLHDAASIATEQNNPLMAQEVLDVNKEHSETSNDDTPPSGGASIDQISTLLDSKMTPLVDALPKDSAGKIIPAASRAKVDDHERRIRQLEQADTWQREEGAYDDTSDEETQEESRQPSRAVEMLKKLFSKRSH